MHQDEDQHRQQAQDAGGAELPLPIKQLMGLVSKIMTKTSFYV
jgi:ubiquinone biosynthesis monooxygenase Coq7